MNRLLIATDGSPAARAAAETGIRLAEEQRAEVVILHVVDAQDVIAPPFGPIIAIPHELGRPRGGRGARSCLGPRA